MAGGDIVSVPFEDQPSRVGRPCRVCTHAQRTEVEAALADGDAVSRISEQFSVGRSSLRRHRSGHMSVTFSEGLSAWATVLRMAEAADRLRDLADDAEDRGRLADATRAVLAEAKTLDLLLALGVRGPEQLDYAKDAAALEAAVTVLLQRVPALGDRIAEQLEQQDRTAYANKFRVYANKCRQLPEHQVSGNERQEIPA